MIPKSFIICVFVSGGRIIRVSGQHLDVVQEPRILVTLTPLEKKKRRRSADPLRRERRIVPEPNCPEDSLCVVKQVEFTQVSLRLCLLSANRPPFTGQLLKYSLVSSCPVLIRWRSGAQ